MVNSGIVVYLRPSDSSNKKYVVTVYEGDNKKTVHFGAKGYEDYTIHKDKRRMELYDIRHSKNEDWNLSGIRTAGFWSKWILWSKPDFMSAVRYTKTKFGIKIILGCPPD